MASPTLLSGHQCPFIKSTSLNHFRVRQNPNPRFFRKFPISASSDPSASSSSWEREEARWLREEQRWLREESRWRSERELLLSQIDALEGRLPTLGKTAASPPLLAEEAEVTETVLDGSRVRVLEVDTEKIVKKQTKRATLRKGSEGEEVRAMQVCDPYIL